MIMNKSNDNTRQASLSQLESNFVREAQEPTTISNIHSSRSSYLQHDAPESFPLTDTEIVSPAYLDVKLRFEGTSRAGFDVKKSTGLMCSCMVSTGLPTYG